MLDEDPNEAGVFSGLSLAGFIEQNQDADVRDYALTAAAEALAPFADAFQGNITTRLPGNGLRLKGNMSGVTLSVAAAPSGRVAVVHEFPGQQKRIDRLAMAPYAIRSFVLGVIPTKGKGEV